GEPASGNESEVRRAQEIRNDFYAGLQAERQSNREEALKDYTQAIELYNKPWAESPPGDLGPIFATAQNNFNKLAPQ
ncbi:MAG: hypothetical protein LC772_09540, partial [Chloroflexi bacterium]|nr:hypothetical protein [Chloroflexota bacterium]